MWISYAQNGGWLSGWWITWREGVRIGKEKHENYEDGSMRNEDSTSTNAFESMRN